MHGARSFASRAIAVLLALVIGLGAELPVLADTIALSLNKGPGEGEVALDWTGGTSPFKVFRGALATSVLNPPNLIATTGGAVHADTPPPASITYYTVVGLGPPEIQSITPGGAGFGAKIVVYGQNFGTDPAAVKVRFSFTDIPSGQNLTVDQPVFEVSDTRIDLAVPMAVPNRINQVTVLVSEVPSPPVPYFVGALPLDPTPGVAGNETLEFIDELDLLVAAFDAKLDPWFVDTGVLDIFSIFAFHGDMYEITDAVAQMRASVAASSASNLAVTDCIVGTPAFQEVIQKVREARAALHGSPLGSIMCEGRDLRDIVLEIVDILNIVDTILTVVSTALDVACGAAVIASIFSLGIASPLAAAICTAAVAVNTILRPIMSAISSVASAMDAIASAAPVDPLPGTLESSFSHPLWGGDPPVVYVQGTFPVEGRLTQDFHNARCAPAGSCTRTFTITILGIPIGIDVDIPHITVQDLAMTCSVKTATSPGYTDLGSIEDGALCRFTGADVGTGWVRGAYDVELQTMCANEVIGPVTRSYTIVSGPRLTSVSPNSGQMRDIVELHGQYMPPLVIGATNKAQALYGDTGQGMISSVADHYSFRVPDSNNVAGTVGLQVQGRDADQTLPFDILPPVLNFARIDPGFEGEEVELHGTGFATNPPSNTVTLNGQPVTVVRSESFGLVFRVPAAANSGPLQLTAINHVSNQLPFGVRRWGTAPGVALSHPARNAYNPVVAAHDDGTAGVAWIDRHASGGEVRLLFTDAAPADSGFRVPVAIAPTVAGTELSGPPSAPQTPDVAIGPDHRFHVAWTNRAGHVLVSSFAKGAAPGAGVVAIAPAVGTVMRDPAVAVMADGSVHVAATEVPTNGGLFDTLLHAVSTNGGATFAAPASFGVTGTGLASEGLHKGEVDLTFADGRLFRAWTQFARGVTPTTGVHYAREIYTQSSTDGVTFSPPAGAGTGKVDVRHSGAPTSSRGAPSVSGDASGAIVAWDAATTKPYNPIPNQPTEIYASREIQVNHAPYFSTEIGVVTPSAPGQQTDVGRPSLVHHTPGGSAMTAIASVRRVSGTSPDELPGVPRVHVRRYPLRGLNNPTLFETTPTVVGLDSTTQDDSPSLAVDAADHYHLAWLQGPQGERVVRYQSTRAAVWPDTLPDNPPPVAAAPRDVIAVNMGNNFISPNQLYHWGVLLVDPEFPEETRWVGVSPIPAQNGTQGRPSMSSSGTLVYSGHGNLYGGSVCSLDGRVRLLGIDDVVAKRHVSRLKYPTATSDGSVFGIMSIPNEFGYEPGVVRRAPGSASFERLGDFIVRDAWDSFLVSPNGRWVANFDSDYGMLLYDVVTDTQIEPSIIYDVNGLPAWSPSSDRLAFKLRAPCSFDPGSECASAVEFNPLTGLTGATLAEMHELFEMSYKPDGTAIVYRCFGAGCCDPTAGPNDNAICTSSGLAVPRTPGMIDESPIWSPDGNSIVFVRTNPSTNNLGALMIWHSGDPAPTALTGPVLGLRNSPLWSHQASWTRIPQ